MKKLTFRLVNRFVKTFQGVVYRHRASTQGDLIALELYEDLFTLAKSKQLNQRISAKDRVVNVRNLRRNIKARRGDGTFGERVPSMPAVEEAGFSVARGQLATVEIGVEVKILAKAMIKQIDRVINDLKGQVTHFRAHGDKPISVGIVGINHAGQYTSYEGDRPFPTDGKRYKHPVQESAQAAERLARLAAPAFDEFLVLHFKASNIEPYPFEWVNAEDTYADYATVLTRVSREYDRRF